MGITQLITCMLAGITNGELHRFAPKLRVYSKAAPKNFFMLQKLLHSQN
ncbi:unnamed protein product [Ixodes pacificus]